MIKNYKQSKSLLISGIFFLLIGLALLLVLITGWEIDENGERISVTSMMSFFFLAGIIVIISYLNYRVSMSDEKLTIVSSFRKRSEVYFSSIDNLSEEKLRNVITIKSNSKTYKISNHIVGYDSLINELIKYIKPENISVELQSGYKSKINSKKWILNGVIFGFIMIVFMGILSPMLTNKDNTQENLLLSISTWMLVGLIWAFIMRRVFK